MIEPVTFQIERAYIASTFGGHLDYDQQLALQGFDRLRVPTQVVKPLDELSLSPTRLLVGGVDEVQRALRLAGRSRSAWNDYPPELAEFYGRKLERTTWGELNRRSGSYFVKRPLKGKFEPGVMRFPWKPTGDDVLDWNAVHVEDDDVILASEPVDFVAEWRAFCIDGQVLDLRQYNGPWRVRPDHWRIERACSLFLPKVRGYSVDFGLTRNGATLVVETNAGHSLGAYGLRPDLYARLIAAAWSGLWGDE